MPVSLQGNRSMIYCLKPMLVLHVGIWIQHICCWLKAPSICWHACYDVAQTHCDCFQSERPKSENFSPSAYIETSFWKSHKFCAKLYFEQVTCYQYTYSKVQPVLFLTFLRIRIYLLNESLIPTSFSRCLRRILFQYGLLSNSPNNCIGNIGNRFRFEATSFGEFS